MKTYLGRIFLLAILILGVVPTLCGQDLVSFEKRIAVKTLDNGLTFIVCERPEAPVFSFFTHVDVGSDREVPGITGLAHMFEHMAFKALQPDAVTLFSLEDVFVGGEADKLAWVNGWRNLPHIKPEVAKLFEYPQRFAEDIFARIEHALRRHVSDSEANAATQTGRLFILSGDDLPADSKASLIPDLPLQYIRSSDMQIVAAHKADSCDQANLLHSRLEGEFVLSYKTSDGWVAITKDILTEVLGAGRDVKVIGLPRVAAEVLKLMCPNLAVL